MNRFFLGIVFVLSLVLLGASATQQEKSKKLTYSVDIAPIVDRLCLPCHLAENENPSGLSLDSFDTLMKGGEKGNPIIPGKPDESFLYTKLLPDPPFGKQMPRGRKKMTEEEIRTIREWIEQGAVKE
jgi:hypothetical protein